MKRAEVMVDNAAYAWATFIDRRSLSKSLEIMLSVVEGQGISTLKHVELRLVGDNTIIAANSRFMACKGPTNVLSFPGEGQMPGLILISTDAICRESLLYGQQRANYMFSLLAHGLAHLVGLEHGVAMSELCDACVAAVRQTVE